MESFKCPACNRTRVKFKPSESKYSLKLVCHRCGKVNTFPKMSKLVAMFRAKLDETDQVIYNRVELDMLLDEVEL